MGITIAGSTIAGMFTAAAFCTALPIILLLVWLKKTGAKAMPFFVGAGIFILFALILEQILHTFCMVLDNPVSRVIKSSVVLYTLYGGLAAGVFEETGRFVAFKVMKSRASRETAITYGIGHGGIESILVAGMNMTVYGVIALLVNRGGLSAAIPIIGDEATAQMVVASIAATTPVACFYTCWERISAVILHIALSVLVFRAVHEPGKGWLYPLAILLHAGLDFIAVLFQQQVISSLMITELMISIFAILVAVFAWRQYRAMPAAVPDGQPGKLTGSVIATVFLAVYFLLYAGVVAIIPGIPVWVKVLFGVIALGGGAVLIAMLVQRMREVRSGELDDLDKY
ncbi:MAG: YhfC family glutamic-type intramembrane protease [Oscillospiraceae bacterium]|nr:YhfC family glutamic-type intramembrane protease [Oscillospiraceae bacterium]MDY4104617.1 YhfC family glutamic-type intramembrane protease [Oscillospiraceae bacterium]